MDIINKKEKRRTGVAFTLGSIITITLIFEYCIITQWTTAFIISEIFLIIVFISSFAITFIKTGLWEFTHKPFEKLDEREIALTGKSLRYAYAILTVFILILLLSYSLLNKQISVVLVASLIIFAHVLPASIIAWTEKHID